MTQYYNDLLNKLRSPEEAPKKEHHLFLLGTGVDYVHRPAAQHSKEAPYIRGELFSYTAQLMTRLLGEQDNVKRDNAPKGSEDYAHQYHSNSVDVIKGADNPGFEVGDRLAKALMLALGAVAEGKTTLSISGFSRGAVESIVLTHELERVRAALEADASKPEQERRSLAEIINDSNSVPGLAIIKHPSYTRQALNKLLPKSKQDDDVQLKEKLLANLNKLQINLFVLDPVPGGNIGKVVRVGWQEESFYTLPALVVKKQEFVQQHETSNCFKPIIPLGMPYEVIPGCHGTGDGNQFDDNGDQFPEQMEKKDVSGAQDLVLRRWLDFTFPDGFPLEEAINLEHPELDAVTNDYLPAVQSERNRQLLKNYEKIQENYPAFEYLATRNYAGLGRYMAERQVHFRQRGNTPITTLDVHGDSKTFLNLQHVTLWMSNTLQEVDFFDKTLVEQVQWLKENIEVAFKDQNPTDVPSNQSAMVSRLLAKQENHSLVKESLSYLINTVTQTYLRNHLSEEERAQCRSCVYNTFLTLSNLPDSLKSKPEMVDLAQSLTKIIRADLTSTVLLHQNALLSLSNKLILEEKVVLKNFDKEEPAGAEQASISWLMDAQKLIADMELFKEQINGLEPWCDQEQLLNDWNKMLPQFGVSTDEISYVTSKERLLQYLEQQQGLLVISASKILKEMPNALENKPEGVEDVFYKNIQRLASVDKVNSQLSAISQELQSKEEELKQVRDAKSSLEDGLSKTEGEQEQLGLMTQSLRVEIAALSEQVSDGKRIIHQQSEDNRSLQQQLIEKEQELQLVRRSLLEMAELSGNLDSFKKSLEVRIGELTDEIVLLKAQLVEKDESLLSVLNENQSLAQKVKKLEQAASEAQLEHDELARVQEEISQLNDQIRSLKEQTTSTKENLSQKQDVLSKANIEIADLKSQIVDLGRQNALASEQLAGEKEARHKANAEISGLKSQIEQLKKQEASTREELTTGLKSEIENLKGQVASSRESLVSEQAQRQQAEEQKASLAEQLHVNADALQKAQEEAARLKAEIEVLRQAQMDNNAKSPAVDFDKETLAKQVKAYQSPEERAAILKIDRLNKLTQDYLTHLIKSDDKSPLMEAKMASTYELLEHLNNTKLLPSEQLSAFNNTLQSTQETLKEHRDPTWMRFFRDCARIITVALSGVGLYRVATGQSPQFFKPSHGENFVEEATKTSAPTAK